MAPPALAFLSGMRFTVAPASAPLLSSGLNSPFSSPVQPWERLIYLICSHSSAPARKAHCHGWAQGRFLCPTEMCPTETCSRESL